MALAVESVPPGGTGLDAVTGNNASPSARSTCPLAASRNPTAIPHPPHEATNTGIPIPRTSSAAGVVISAKHDVRVKNFLDYLATVEGEANAREDDHHVTLKIEMRIVRSHDAEAVAVRITNDPAAPAVQLREEDILKKYPFTYKTLTAKLKARYRDFVENDAYHKVRRTMEVEPRYCLARYLDPANSRSGRKRFYSGEILAAFDKHYTRNS